nr:28 kda heat shock protein homolog fragment 1 [human, Peptide Partial, 9 aa] [Homo sapiens]
DWYPHSRLF